MFKQCNMFGPNFLAIKAANYVENKLTGASSIDEAINFRGR